MIILDEYRKGAVTVLEMRFPNTCEGWRAWLRLVDRVRATGTKFAVKIEKPSDEKRVGILEVAG